MIKKLFRGAFNLNRAPVVMYAHAWTERQAWLVFCRRLAKRDGVHPSHVMSIFDGSKANYEITIETEYKEDDTDEKRI